MTGLSYVSPSLAAQSVASPDPPPPPAVDGGEPERVDARSFWLGVAFSGACAFSGAAIGVAIGFWMLAPPPPPASTAACGPGQALQPGQSCGFVFQFSLPAPPRATGSAL